MTTASSISLPDPNTLCEVLIQDIKRTLPRDTLIVGIRTGGVLVAERIRTALAPDMPLGMLDISFYRDDFARIGLHPQVKPTTLPFDIADRTILLVDDVLFTGRTIRAAMNELFDWGRPARILLAVLIDRHAKEVPLAADYIGAVIETALTDDIQLTEDSEGHLKLAIKHAEPATE